MATPTWKQKFDQAGYCQITGAISVETVKQLAARLATESGRGGSRTADQDPLVIQIAFEREGIELARAAIGPRARPVRVIFFDKRPDANWSVPYHQDLTIALAERRETSGFGPWTIKAGTPHAQAPAELLEQMVAVRFHLDDCGLDNGPLRVIPATHRMGKLSGTEIDKIVAGQTEELVTSDCSGAILMRPLLLHASSPAQSPSHRRVLHIEYAAADLPTGLQWQLAHPLLVPRDEEEKESQESSAE